MLLPESHPVRGKKKKKPNFPSVHMETHRGKNVPKLRLPVKVFIFATSGMSTYNRLLSVVGIEFRRMAGGGDHGRFVAGFVATLFRAAVRLFRLR